MSNLSIANFTVIGYNVRDERLKDELISNVSYQEIEVNSSSFSPEEIIKQFTRDKKIDSIFNNFNSANNPTHILLDVNNIKYQDIKKVVSNIHNYLMLNNYVYKFILTTSLNRNISGGNHLSISSSLLYMSDLVYVISDGIVKIEKNRYGNY